jgi:hypothetical protein
MGRIGKWVVLALFLSLVAVGYRLATRQPNEDFRNYEIVYAKPDGWKELPHSPNTLLLIQHPKTKALIRCAATQVVADRNPEPEMDTDNLIRRVVRNAREAQAEWKTDQMESFDNGKVRFAIYRKIGERKTVIGALSVRGNTTLLVSISNTGQGAKDLAAGKIEELVAFLKTFDMQETHKWGPTE